MLIAMLLLQAVPAPPDTITDADIVALAAKYDKYDRSTRQRFLGIHNGRRVEVLYRCSDVCPQYTTRVIHYDLDPGPACAAVGGVERSATIPRGIASTEKVFCVPAVLGTEPIPLGGG